MDEMAEMSARKLLHLVTPRDALERRVPIMNEGQRNSFRARLTSVLTSRLLLALIVPLLGWLSGTAFSQISPGRLARAHESLNGATNCTECHQLGAGKATYKCLDCHSEIASRLTARRGLHTSYGIAPGSSQECSRCHAEHNGEDFPLIKWDVKTFDHKQTGFALEGKHSGVACNRCHNPERISGAERPRIKVKDLNKTYLGVSQNCTTCHQDKHNGRLGQNCSQCHNYADWKNISQFDHAKTRYPLTGLHLKVACEKCHLPGPDNKPRYAGFAFARCSDCHADPHKESFGKQSCQSCHNTGGWKRVSTAAMNERFDHSKTRYPLLGKHQTVSCSQCHASGDFKKPLAFGKCMDCHTSDPHSGQFAKRTDGGECASCHNVDSFKPSLFGLKEHATTAYPLEGGHAKLQCTQCHFPKGKDTLYKIKFALCMDCHMDEHQGQFAGAPYQNRCEQCHTVQGYRPSSFTLARHKETRFLLTGGHIAIPCADCHKSRPTPESSVQFRFEDRSCTVCHSDPHQGQFSQTMQLPGPAERERSCEVCHSTTSWRELSRFDHAKTSFPLLGAHRAVGCIDCHKPPNLETKLIHVNFKEAPGKCQECHEEVHGLQFAKDGTTECAECHNTNKWRPSTFDHDLRTTFPLEGVHRHVRCADCHKLIRRVETKQVLFYKPTPKECAACHGPGK